MILQLPIAMIAGWINRHQQQVIAYLLEENRTLHAKLGSRRTRFTDAERRRLAALAFPLGRKRLKSLAILTTPDTLIRWYKQLVAQKFDSSQLGHPVDKIAVRNILRRHHIDPAPKRRQGGMSWSQFLKMHCDMLAATDFFTVEVATWHGLVTYYVLVVIELSTHHQGLNNQLIAPQPEVGVPTGSVRRRERLGGLLSYYCREAA
jgi:hypothetical protein